MGRYVRQDELPASHAAWRGVFPVALLLAGFCTPAAVVHAAGPHGRTVPGMPWLAFQDLWIQSQAFPVPLDLGATDPLQRVSPRSRAGPQRAGAAVAELPRPLPVLSVPSPAMRELPRLVHGRTRILEARAPRGPPAVHVRDRTS